MKTIKIILSILPFFLCIIGIILSNKAIVGEDYTEIGQLIVFAGALVMIFNQKSEISKLKQKIIDLESRT